MIPLVVLMYLTLGHGWYPRIEKNSITENGHVTQVIAMKGVEFFGMDCFEIFEVFLEFF